MLHPLTNVAYNRKHPTMKLNQATIVAFLSATVVASAATHEEMKDKIASLLVAPKLHRMLELSNECIAHTEALFDSMLMNVESVMDACPEANTQYGNTMIIDYSVCDPEFTNSLTEACNTANGNIASGLGDIRMDCTYMGESITVVSKEIPECLAKSCDLSNWETDKGQIFDDSAGELETAFSELGIYCRINNASSAGKVTGVLALALTSATTAIVFF